MTLLPHAELGLRIADRQDGSTLGYRRIIDGADGCPAEVAVGRGNRRAAWVIPGGATRRESCRSVLGVDLAGPLYYTTFIVSKIPLQCWGNDRSMAS
ncbi:MAG: hypothetical protein V9G98_13155 [Candidatus Competibacter sp.]